jgi:hypothetical protein
VRVHEQDDAIREDAGQLRETRVALGRRDVRWDIAAGKRLESKQQPVRIVGHFEDELAVVLQGEDHPCALCLVSERSRAPSSDDQEQREGRSP